VVKLDCGGVVEGGRNSLKLELKNGKAARAKTVVVAPSARYRRPLIANLAEFEGAGVSYWASPVEAKLCERALGWPGVFAIGDVRAGSTKRIAAAVGECAAVVAKIHSLLAEDER
jgi:thioredoxin reductase